MNTKLYRISSVLAIAILFLMTIVIGNAFGFGLKNLTGGKKEGTLSVDSLVDKQGNLCKRLYAALADINKAQQHFAQAVDDKETMEKLLEIAEDIKKGNVEGNSLNNTMGETINAAEVIASKLEKAKQWDEKRKRELQKGLVPYATGTAHSVLIGKEFADNLKSTKDAIQQAGITGALSVKKKLGVTIDVAPNLPKLGQNLFTTANTAIQVAKRENLPTEGAEKALGEDPA